MKRIIHFIKSWQIGQDKKMEKRQITSVQNERGIATERKIKRYLKQLYANKFNINEMKIPEQYTFQKLTQREILNTTE